MRLLSLAAVLAAVCLGGCNSTSDRVSDVNSAFGSGFSRDVNPNGTQRRPDVNYAFTRPTLPSIVNR